MKSKRRVSEKVLEALAERLALTLETGSESWPLPYPPQSDPDFPPVHPKDKQQVIDLGIGLLQADKGMFDRHLSIVVDMIVPHRMNLSDDPFEIHERWLLKRLDVLTERLLFAIATEWLAQALDRSNPSPDRWWLSVVMVNGLCGASHGQPVHQGYHLVESIALAERPGTWHTQPDVSNANMDWNPHGMVPRTTSVVAHEAGAEAAVWLMTQLENSGEERRKLLIEWCRLLLERKELIVPLGISQILIRRASDSSQEVSSRVVVCLAKLIEGDKDSGLECIRILNSREDLLTRRAMADVLTRLFRRITTDAIPLLNSMLEDEDESVLAAASATIGDLRFLDKEMWADKIRELCDHKSQTVRRNIVYTIRDYLEEYSDDKRQIIPKLWGDGDETVITRLRELLMRMDEVDADRFARTIRSLEHLNIDGLWAPMKIRNQERAEQWQLWLEGKAEQPETPPAPEIHISNMTEGELPELSDALDTLDDMGFLD
ncbi:MAG: hypothetical protein HOE76_02255 [Euryarchaeota archaeon]|jgi:hypothetical protein|nr:hypothetical protein [Euryarchaeota archaeon]MBT4981883.1 hypothetical protein [Euryarchaeota archaeon]MBT5184339.1 hypothetical protein [Euryarchaeota archaeon]